MAGDRRNGCVRVAGGLIARAVTRIVRATIFGRTQIIAVAVCDAVERSPGYGALAELLQTLFGDRVAGAFRAPFAIGDASLLAGLAQQAGLQRAEVLSRSAIVRFASIDALVSTERACIWTLGGLLDDAQFERLLHEARRVLAPFVQHDGSVAFQMPALIIAARRP